MLMQEEPSRSDAVCRSFTKIPADALPLGRVFTYVRGCAFNYLSNLLPAGIKSI
jgi:hypothetical protein